MHERTAREALLFAAEMDFSLPPPVSAQRISRRLREITGVADAYREDKKRFNRIMMELYPALKETVAGSADPLAAATRFAVAGNVIDLGVKIGLTEAEALAEIDRAVETPLEGDLDGFLSAVRAARRILYLADNAGEIVMDRLWIEQLPAGRVTVAVRGAPVLNDATREDAETVGLDRIAEIIDNGSDAPGTILAECGGEFLRRFHETDLVVAKGQGNYETLDDGPGTIFFLLKVKCAVVAAHTGLELGSHAVLRSRASSSVRTPSSGLVMTPRAARQERHGSGPLDWR